MGCVVGASSTKLLDPVIVSVTMVQAGICSAIGVSKVWNSALNTWGFAEMGLGCRGCVSQYVLGRLDVLFPFSLGQTEMLWGTSCTRLELPQAAEAGRAELLLIYPDSIIASCFQEFACACRCRHRKEVASFKLGRKKKKTHNKTPFLKTICREPSMLLTPLILQLFLILFWHLCWN